MKIALIGYGKMGKTIARLAQEAGDEVILRIDHNNSLEANKARLQEADVAIEFSQPEVAFQNIHFCIENGVPIVSGTTGWLDKLEELKTFCEKKKGAFFYAANFSIGVNLFFAVNRYVAELMNKWPQYDVGTSETHHQYKLDFPSGTGLVVAEDIVERLERKDKWVAGPAAESAELGLSSLRFGQVPGTHEVHYDSVVDSIHISHTARSREGFAQGALMAASWLIGKEGCFGMEDLLKK